MGSPPPTSPRKRPQNRSVSSPLSSGFSRPSGMTSVSSSTPIPISGQRVPYPPLLPTRSSPSSSRQHPYSRQPNLPQNPPAGSTVPRIYLPAPHSDAPLNVGIDDPPRPSSSALQIPPSWRRGPTSPGSYRAVSDSARGLNLPPLQFVSTASPGPSRAESSMAPLRRDSPLNPPQTGLRPSYTGDEPPPSGRWKDDPYEMRSPPLRALPASARSPPDRDRFVPPYPQYYHPSSSQLRPQSDPTGRARSHSTASRRSEEEGPPPPALEPAGKSRRMAHLMSEQKRREYAFSTLQSHVADWDG